MRPLRLVKIAFTAALCLAVVGALTFAAFNAWFYPPHGIENLRKDQDFTAWERAAKDFCSSSGLTYQGVDLYKFRKVDTGPEAYAWGTAKCLTPDGHERLAWIYLYWSTKRHLWMRNTLTVLADDDDEVYYSPTAPRQFDRARIALSKIMAENARRVREYRQAGSR
ncbi:hypothetical protein JCM15519_16240 [Fundidesulfovibrio butyratiphilus]